MAVTNQEQQQAFRTLADAHDWRILDEKQIKHGTQFVVQTPTGKVTVNCYATGKIVVGGKSGSDRELIQAWASQAMATARRALSGREGRETTYFVLPHQIDEVWQQVLSNLPGQVTERSPSGSGQLYGAEIRDGSDRVTLTQYRSGTLMVQGANCVLFDLVCQELDRHLHQSIEQRASRLLLSKSARSTAEGYIKRPEVENEAADWLNRQLSPEAQRFLHPNDLLTLLSGVAVKLALGRLNQTLPDYSVIVAGFGKAFEGFVIRLAEHFGLVNSADLQKHADAIQIGNWLEEIARRLPDPKRYSAEISALQSAWQCRNKAMHSDRFHAYSLLRTPEQAEQEILTILRAMNRSFGALVSENVQLKVKGEEGQVAGHEQPPKLDQRFEKVNRQSLYDRLRADNLPVKMLAPNKKNEWELITNNLKVIAPRDRPGLVIVAGADTQRFCQQYHDLLEQKEETRCALIYIGADESGKGDVFGPLAAAAVAVDAAQSDILVEAGVRDSKELSDEAIRAIAHRIRESCPHVVTVLMPEQYNQLYESQGANLNDLLAWAHARNIQQLSAETGAERALIDQFADESVMRNAMAEIGCMTHFEQRPHAEDDVAVAAASVLARDAFVSAVAKLGQEYQVPLPLGASSPKVYEAVQRIYEQQGIAVLSKVAKMHFSIVSECIRRSQK